MRVSVRALFLLLYCLYWMVSCPAIHAQETGKAAGNDRRLSPALLTGAPRHKEILTLTLTVSDPALFKKLLAQLPDSVRVLEEYAPGRMLTIRCRYGNFLQHILPMDGLLFADRGHGRPREEQAIADADLGANAVLLAHREYPGITGRGMVVSVREDLFDSSDIDLRGRVRPSPLASTFFSTHATIMATMIGGAGNSFYSGEGVATRATLSSYNFNSLLPDPDSIYRADGISVQNHSYGSAIEDYYGNEAAAHDLSANINPALLHVFSAGNSGDQAAVSGTYSGIIGMADLTGNYKMAKNILTVGSTDSFGHVLALSSKGPAYDGRVKPELVAFGQDGSSGAAAIVSGVSLLLQESFSSGHNGQRPPSDLVKAVLLNSADDAGPPGIDFLTGYGRVNACRALQTMEGRQYFTGSLQNGEENNYTLSIPVTARNFRVTLVWNDPAALPNAYTALVNDLDLELSGPGGQRWLPWVLQTAPDALGALPVRERDSLNNIEQVSITGSDLSAGSYTVRVRGSGIPAGHQTYSLVYGWDSADAFKWAYPVGGAAILPGAANLLRWETTRPGTGLLEYSLDSGQHWVQIDAGVDLSRSYYYWTAPDTLATGMLRISAGGDRIVSEPFPIGKPLALSVGFDCPDSFFLFWNAGKGAGGYQVYALGDEALTPLVLANDSFLLLDKAQHSGLYYAVAPLLPYRVSGRISHAVNYTTQGVGCYVSSFTADRQQPSSALLRLILGTGYRVRRVGIEKWTAGGWQTLSVTDAVSSLAFSVVDLHCIQGANRYRAAITLTDDRVIYSEEEVVYDPGTSPYLVYPNPVSRQGILHILSAEAGGDAVLVVVDLLGRKVYEGRLVNNPQDLGPGRWAKGLYFFTIVRDGRRVQRGKILIN